jgi:hypothetical protein
LVMGQMKVSVITWQGTKDSTVGHVEDDFS